MMSLNIAVFFFFSSLSVLFPTGYPIFQIFLIIFFLLNISNLHLTIRRGSAMLYLLGVFLIAVSLYSGVRSYGRVDVLINNLECTIFLILLAYFSDFYKNKLELAEFVRFGYFGIFVSAIFIASISVILMFNRDVFEGMSIFSKFRQVSQHSQSSLSTISDYNVYGFFFVSTLVFTIQYKNHFLKLRGGHAVFLLVFGLLSFVILASGSRRSTVLLSIVVVFFCGFLLRQKFKLNSFIHYVSIAFPLGLLALPVVMAHLGELRSIERFANAELISPLRLSILSASIEILSTNYNSLLGTSQPYNDLLAEKIGLQLVTPHNFFLALWLSAGIFGLLLAILISSILFSAFFVDFKRGNIVCLIPVFIFLNMMISGDFPFGNRILIVFFVLSRMGLQGGYLHNKSIR